MDDSHTALLHNSGRSTMKQQSSDDNYMLDKRVEREDSWIHTSEINGD